MNRKAFARAWSFLQYHPVAKWSAMSAAVAAALLYVAMLVVLGLFADLIVNRGQIPSYANLSAQRQQAAQDAWDALSPEEREHRLSQMGLVPLTAHRLAAVRAGEADSADLDLIWRAQVIALLNRDVNGLAAAIVLPDYHLLPPAAQQEFGQVWQKEPVA